MTMIKLSFLFAALLSSVVLSGPVTTGNGWGGSGNGDYITYQKNPWFLGERPFRYCISHSKESFSLDQASSEKAIDSTLKDFFEVVEYRNKWGSYNIPCDPRQNPDCFQMLMRFPSTRILGGDFSNPYAYPYNPAGYGSNNYLYFTDKYEKVEDCGQADLTISLGDTNFPVLKKAIMELGLERFKSQASFYRMTSYDFLNYRAKGLIYIAADKGPNKYNGQLSPFIKSDTIWDMHTKLRSGIPLPPWELSDPTLGSSLRQLRSNDLKVETMGVLKPVFLRELGHILGFGDNGHIPMDNAFIYSLMLRGLEYKDKYESYKNFLLNYSFVGKDQLEIYINNKSYFNGETVFDLWLKEQGIGKDAFLLRYQPKLQVDMNEMVYSTKGILEILRVDAPSRSLKKTSTLKEFKLQTVTNIMSEEGQVQYIGETRFRTEKPDGTRLALDLFSLLIPEIRMVFEYQGKSYLARFGTRSLDFDGFVMIEIYDYETGEWLAVSGKTATIRVRPANYEGVIE